MNPRRLIIPTLSVLIVIAALVALVWVRGERSKRETLSDVITTVPEGEPVHRQILLPKLEDRTMVVPDRPHNPREGQTGEHFDLAAQAASMSRQRTFHISTNSIGVRGPEIEVPSPKYRVICAGDSITFGWGVAYDESWPARLEQELDVDTVTAAWPGARYDHLFDWLYDNIERLDGDLLLFSLSPAVDDAHLDAWVARMEQARKDLAPMPIGWVLPPAGTFDPTAVEAAAELYPTLQARVPEVPVLDLTPAFRAALPMPGVVGDFEGDKQRMISLPSGEVLVEAPAVVDPEFGELLADEMIAAFEADHSRKEPLFFDQGHPDAEGFEIFAREVATWMTAQGWGP